MSEYQYYDFRAIDRPLTSFQRGELGKISTPAGGLGGARIVVGTFTGAFD